MLVCRQHQSPYQFIQSNKHNNRKDLEFLFQFHHAWNHLPKKFTFQHQVQFLVILIVTLIDSLSKCNNCLWRRWNKFCISYFAPIVPASINSNFWIVVYIDIVSQVTISIVIVFNIVVFIDSGRIIFEIMFEVLFIEFVVSISEIFYFLSFFLSKWAYRKSSLAFMV